MAFLLQAIFCFGVSPAALYIFYYKAHPKICLIKISRGVYSDNLGLGTEQKEYNGSSIRIFRRERMLVELVRHKKKLPFDYYKEVIGNYRKLLYQLDIQAIEEYAEKLPKIKLVMETLRMEVF